MKLVIIPDVDGPSMAIIDENFPPENYVDIDRDTAGRLGVRNTRRIC